MQKVVSVHFNCVDEDKAIEELANKVISKCFEEEKINNLNIYVSITFTIPSEIKILNKEYREIDRETDVLSFPMFQKEEVDNIILKQIKMPIEEVLGDIVISVEKVKEQAKEYGHSFERELSYMIVHGFYHLMGYDHIEEKDKLLMREKEEKVLNCLRIVR